MRARYIGLLVSEVMSHAAPTLCINVPMSDAKSAIRRFRKMRMRSGRQGLGEGPGFSFWDIIEKSLCGSSCSARSDPLQQEEIVCRAIAKAQPRRGGQGGWQ